MKLPILAPMLVSAIAYATLPVVSYVKVTASKSTSVADPSGGRPVNLATGTVDYVVEDKEGDSVFISLLVSGDGGLSYPYVPDSLSGAFGWVKSGTDHKSMQFSLTTFAKLGGACRVRVVASDDKLGLGSQQTLTFLMAHRKADGRFGPRWGTKSHKNWNLEAAMAVKYLGFKLADEARMGIRSSGSLATLTEPEIQADLLPNLIPTTWQATVPLSLINIPTYLGLGDLTDSEVGSVSPRDIRWAVILAKIRGRAIADVTKITNWIMALQKDDGGYNSIPDGFVDRQTELKAFALAQTGPTPPTGTPRYRGHISQTFSSVACLKENGAVPAAQPKTIQFAQACQLADGGFGYAPSTSTLDYGNISDMWYTWLALKTLKLLAADATDKTKAAAWIESCHNRDGGYGDRPGWPSRIQTTWYAAEALGILGIAPQVGRVSPVGSKPIPSNYKVWRAQFSLAHTSNVIASNDGYTSGGGDRHVDYMAEFSNKYPVDLIGLRGPTAIPDSVTKRLTRNVKFVVGDEIRNAMSFSSGANIRMTHWLNIYVPVPGKFPGTSETGYAFDDGTSIPGDYFQFDFSPTSILSGTYQKIRDKNGLVFGEVVQREAVYMLSDLGGPNGVFGSGHDRAKEFAGHPNNSNEMCYLERFAGRAALVADVDGHENLPLGYYFGTKTQQSARTLFLGPDNSWDSFMKALKDGQTAMVQRPFGEGDWTYPDVKVEADFITKDNPIYCFGYQESVEFIQSHRSDWQWW